MATVDFFLGSSTPAGFLSLFEPVVRPPVTSFLLKGAAGSGKSTILNRICSTFTDHRHIVERIHCAGDPDSLDGVIFQKTKTAILDATAPHVFSSVYPIAVETEISLYPCISYGKIKPYRNDVIQLVNRNKLLSIRCYNFLQAACSLLTDNRALVAEQTDTAKIERLVKRICTKEFPRRDTPYLEHLRFLSALTPEGYLTYGDTPKQLCQRIYLLRDEYGVASEKFLKGVREYALGNGHECYTCLNPLFPDQIEHLFFPQLGVGFFTANRYHEEFFTPCRVITSARFTNTEELKKHRQTICFRKKAANELLKQGISLLDAQRECHSQLENIYTHATDFNQIDLITAGLMNRLARLL